MTAYTDRFGGSTVQPSDVGFRAVALSASITTVWPSFATAANECARIMKVSASVGSLTIELPDARLAATGQDVLFDNSGAETFTVLDADGDSVCTLTGGQVKYLYLSDNSTAAGTWRVTLFGASSSNLDASQLAGYGLKAISNTINAAPAMTSVSGDTTVVAADRAKVFLWEGGSGTLTLPTTVGSTSDFHIEVRNQGSGTVTVQPVGGVLIDGSSNIELSVNESCFVHMGATDWSTVGRGRNTAFNFTRLSKVVTGGTETLTLTEASSVVQTYTGTLTSNQVIQVPAVVQVYYVSNGTTGSYTLGFECVTGGSANVTVLQGQAAILFCDGSTVINANTSVSGITTIVFGAGSAAGPSVAIANSATGFYASGTNEIGVSLNGVYIGKFAAGGLTLDGLTASSAVATDASKKLVSVANTGTGSNVLATSPTLVTPVLGVAAVTSVNKVALTAPATGSTLTIADGKTLTASNTLTLTATDGSTLAIGTGGTLGTAAYTASTAYDVAGAAAAVTPTTLGLVIGTNVQAYDADLTTWAGVTPGTGVATALAVAVGSAGAVVVDGGTPSALNLSNATAYPGTSALVTTGALNSGSITSGFGSIDIGTDAITCGGMSTGNVLLAPSPLFGAGVVGLSNRSADSTLYLQMPANGMNITDNALNTKVSFTSTGINSTNIGATTPGSGAFTTLSATTRTLQKSSGSDSVATGGYFQIGDTAGLQAIIQQNSAGGLTFWQDNSGWVANMTLSKGGSLSLVDTTDATSTTAASLKTAGGLAVAKKAYFGDTVYAPNIVSAGTLYAQNLVVGADIIWTQSTDTYSRSSGISASTQVVTDIHTSMRRCVVRDDLTVAYYLDPSNSALKADGTASVLTGADGQVMVEIPATYVKFTPGASREWAISMIPAPGYSLHPAFMKDSVFVPYRYRGAYTASYYDVSAGTYNDGYNWDSNPTIDATATTGDKLASVSGKYPLVGVTRNTCRIVAANRGPGWRVNDYWLEELVKLLFLVEYGSFNTQAKLGDGNAAGSYAAGSSGTQTDSPHSIAGKSNSLGNASTNTSTGASSGTRDTAFMSYRGIENWYGNCWQFVDGINVNNGQTYVSNTRSTFADDTVTGYDSLGVVNYQGSGWQTDLQQLPFSFLPSAVGGGSSSYLGDYYWYAGGWKVSLAGAGANYGSDGGAFAWAAITGSSSADRSISARLAC